MNEHEPMDCCKYRQCGRPLEQRAGGRRREYCDDACRQAEHRARQADAALLSARREIASWGDFQPATVDELAGYLVAGNRQTARRLADLILAEQLVVKQERYELQSQTALGESRLQTAHRSIEQLQERFREYVATSSARLGKMAGELARYRQEEERQLADQQDQDRQELQS